MSITVLMSVYDKTGLEKLARGMVGLNCDLISSGGTSLALKGFNIIHRRVEDVTGFPEMLDGRVKTLHPKIHGGILADRGKPEHMHQLDIHDIGPIDIVVCNLYPFAATVASGASRQACIEKIDVGGPTMVRAAAKNQDSVAVVVDPADYELVLAELRANGAISQEVRERLAVKAFAHTAAYDADITNWGSNGEYSAVVGRRVLECKYGENAWQSPAALYTTRSDDPLALDRFRVVAGSAPSYNNLCDVDRLLQTMTHIAAGLSRNFNRTSKIAVGVKHGNACCAAVGEHPVDVITRAYEGDGRAIFGGVFMTNFTVTRQVAERLGELGAKLDGIVAPAFEEGAAEILERKGGKCRFLENPALRRLDETSLDVTARRRQVRGGFLAQPNYSYVLDLSQVEAVYGNIEGRELDLVLAWAIGSTSNSNTVCIVRDGMLLGNGVGQQDRVGCCELAIKRAIDAGHVLEGAVAFSDSFFPYPDGPEVLMAAGVRHVMTTKGSINDAKVADAFLQQGFLFWQPDADARGFYGH